MFIDFPFGKTVLGLEIPDDNIDCIVEPQYKQAAKDGVAEVKRAIENPIGNPLNHLVNPDSTIVIAVTDITRATPNRLVIAPLLEKLRNLKVKKQNIKIIIANGLHRDAAHEEMIELLGDEILKQYTVLNHNCRDNTQLINIGRTSRGTDLVLNKNVVEADLVVGTGLIEPHFFAGYSGGPKIILPGLASEKSVFQNHSFKMINHEGARYGVLEGNPIHEDMLEAAKKTSLKFILNVVLNKKREIIRAFAGASLIETHRAATNFLYDMIKFPVQKPADIVITSNGGYPLDRNFYQAVKGMATAEVIVKRGGIIIVFCESRDGIEHQSFYDIMLKAKTPDDILSFIKMNEPISDQWQNQVLARILKKAHVIAVTKGVEDYEIENMMMTPASTAKEALELAFKKKGNDAKIIAIPEGPYAFPIINNK